ncbi:hypothetical protein GCM10010485_28800 [Streptosporangium carneum]
MGRWRPGELPERTPFWDGERIRLNDEAFSASPSAIRVLGERYGVRWLLADERRVPPGARLGDHAELRFRSGDYALYRVPDNPA